MSSLHAISSGHAGSGRDGRRGDREKRASRFDGHRMISAGAAGARLGRPNWCMHQLDLDDAFRPQHDCLAYENELRAQRHCPPIEAER